MISLHDVVALKRDLPEHSLVRGMVGTVVLVFDEPARAFEVEFCDAGGVTIVLLPLLPDDVELIRDLDREVEPGASTRTQ